MNKGHFHLPASKYSHQAQVTLSDFNKTPSWTDYVNYSDVRLPVATLLQQFKQNRHSPLIRHFDLLYIQQGFDRLQSSEISELLPALTHDIAADASVSATHGAIVFHLFLRSLGVYKLPPRGAEEDVKLPTTLNVSTADIAFLSNWIGKLLLFRIASPTTRLTSPYTRIPSRTTGITSPTTTPTTEGNNTCPGLSRGEYAFLTLHGKPDTWDTTNPSGMSATEAKIKTLGLLASGLFSSEDRLFPALFASADQNSKIADVGEEILKRSLPSVNLDDETFISRLYNIYLGGHAAVESNPSDMVSPVRSPLRAKILAILSRSESSTTFPRKIVSIVQKDLARNGQNPAGGAPKTDRETVKLRSAIITFLAFVARRASHQDLNIIARPVIVALKDFVEYQDGGNLSLDEKTVRSSTYEIIGQIAGAHKPILLENNLSLLRWLFQSLCEERQKDVIVSIDEALSSTLRCFQENLDDDVESSLRKILLTTINQESNNTRNVRYAVVRFANRSLAYNDVVARWIDLMVAANPSESHEAVEEAKKGLDPYWFRLFHSSDDVIMDTSGNSIQDNVKARGDFPSFGELVEYIFGEENASTAEPSVITSAVSYCRQALIFEALSTYHHAIEINTEWERKLDLAASQDQGAQRAIRQYLQDSVDNLNGTSSIRTLWNAALKCMDSDQAATLRVTCAQVLVELCTFSPDSLISQMSHSLPNLESSILGNNSELRSLAAGAYGLLSSSSVDSQTNLEQSLNNMTQIMKTWKGATGAQIFKIHGATLSIASFVSHRKYHDEKDTVAENVLSRVLPVLLDMIKEANDPLIYQAAYTALGQLCSFYAVSSHRIADHMPIQEVAEKIVKWANAGQEKAIKALGYLSTVCKEDDEDGMLTKIIEQIRSLHEVRQAETQFAVGEALTCAASGWDSEALTLDVGGPVPTGPSRSGTLAKVVEEILEDSKTTKPALKKV